MQHTTALLIIALVVSQVHGEVLKCVMNLWKGSDFIYTTNGNVGDNTWVMTLDGKKIGFNIEPNCGYTLNLEWQKMPPGYEIKGGWEWFDSDDEGSDSDDEGGGVYCWSGLGNAAAEYALTKVRNLYIGQVEYEKGHYP